LNQDEYTEFVIHNPIYDVLTLFNKSYCILMRPTPGGTNFAAMNFEFVFMKDENLTELYEKHGSLQDIEVPADYQEIWNTVNLPIQTQKLDTANITDPDRREAILTTLSKRAFYLTRLAEQHGAKNIAEVGTAQGWQFFSFAHYVESVGGTITTCDIRDVRNPTYLEKYKDKENIRFISGTSADMAKVLSDVDLYYIDGSHDQEAVVTDVANLRNTQSADPLWIFDDFDVRFGCYQDIVQLVTAGAPFRVYAVGDTASGAPSHQAIVRGQYNIQPTDPQK
jgi:predicted O-methyltransferase YrrM